MSRVRVECGAAGAGAGAGAARAHCVPAALGRDAPAAVRRYFEPYVREAAGGELTASFRGRPLDGTTMKLPQGYSAVVITETRKPLSEDADRKFQVSGAFKEFVYWNYDKKPSKNDSLAKAFDWVDIAEANRASEMADDIDIEEHDVLNHPYIRATFPDLSLVKQEIFCDEEEEKGFEESQMNGEYASIKQYLRTEGQEARPTVATPFPADSIVNLQVTEPAFIEKHSNDQLTSIERDEREISCITLGNLDETPENTEREKDKSIDEVSVCEKEDTQHLLVEKCFNAYIPVEGLNSNHAQSKPISIAKPKRQKALKSTAKPITTSTATSAVDAPSSECHKCQICSTVCATQGDLIAHLYDHVSEPVHKCDFCNETFAQKQFLEVHLWVHAKDKVSEANSKVSSPQKVKIGRISAVNSRAITKCLMSSDSLSSATVSSATVSSATVSFENLGWKSSECPKCRWCFVEDQAYIAHFKRSHGQVIDTVPAHARLNFVRKKCVYCEKSMVNLKKYNDHVRQRHTSMSCENCGESFKTAYQRVSHYKRCSLQTETITPETSKSDVENLKENVNLEVKFFYKCRICEISFMTYKRGYRHKLKHHRYEKNVIVRNTQKLMLRKKNPPKGKVPDSSGADNTVAKILARENHPNVNNRTSGVKISRHTLYQCGTCKSHMFKKSIKIHQGKTMCTTATYGICHICGLSFVGRSIETHLRHHEKSLVPRRAQDFIIKSMSGDVIKLDLHSVISRLPKCNRCGLTFNSFLDLCGIECQNLVSKMCKICDATFDTNTYNWHLSLHELEYYSTSPRSSGARETSREESVSKELNISIPSESNLTKSDLTLVRCGKCKTHIHYNNFGIKIHKDMKNCQKLPIFVCTECGLTFTKKILCRHRNLHNRSDVPLTMSSFRILRMEDMKPVKKELCRFAECKKCNLHHEGGNCWLSHINYIHCKDDPQPRIKCETCNMIFTATSFKLHLPYYGCQENQPSASNEMDISRQDDDISEMLEKYNEMPEQWCQLYECKECSLIVDSYEAVERHCLEHLKPTFQDDPAKQTCNTCGLTFESVSYTKHREYHFSKPGLGRQDFETIQYNPLHYKNRSWSKHYFTNTKFKVILKQNGPKEHTLYQCNNCKTYFPTRNNAYHHSINKLNCPTAEYHCKVCNLYFSFRSSKIHTDYHKSNPGLGANSFRILSFIPGKKSTDKTKSRERTTRVLKGVRPEDIKREREKKALQLFRCERCKLHFMHISAANTHSKFCGRIMNSHKRKKCNDCHLSFSAATLHRHVLVHHTNNTYRRGDFTIKTVKPINSSILRKNRIIIGAAKNSQSNRTAKTEHIKTAKLFKCVPCGVHFASNTSIFKHQSHHMACDTLNIKRCGSCGLEFMIRSLEAHTRIHHGKNSYGVNDFMIIPKTPRDNHMARLYYCVSCDCHYLTNKVLKSHFGPHKKRGQATTCKKCGLNFSVKSITKHNQYHHQQLKLGIDDFKVVKISYISKQKGFRVGTKSNIKNSHVKGHTIYKCLKCNVHYLRKYTVSKRHKSCPKNVHTVDCNVCGLLFTNHSVKLHQNFHHKKLKLTLKDLNVIGVNSVNKETINIYKCAKCQLHCLKAKFVYSHLVNHDRKKLASETCGKCGLLFPITSLNLHRELHHGNNQVHVNVICVGKRSKWVLNDISKQSVIKKKSHRKPRSPQRLLKKTKVKKKHTKATPTKRVLKKIKVYKCRKCGVHYFDKTTLQKHLVDHVAAPRVLDCVDCGLLLTTHNYKMHMNVHHQKAKMTLDDFEVIELNSANDSKADVDSDADDVIEVNSADHKLDLDSETDDVIELDTADDTKMDVDSEINDVIKSNTIDDSKMDFESETNKAYSNESDVNMTNNKSKTLTNAVLYKCKICDVHFLQKQTFRLHMYIHRNNKQIPLNIFFECEFCKCKFTRKSLEKHKIIHHGQNNVFNFVIDEYDPFSGGDIMSPNKQNKDVYGNATDITIDETNDGINCMVESDNTGHVDNSTQDLDVVTDAGRPTDEPVELFHEMADAVLKKENNTINSEEENLNNFKCAICTEVFKSQVARKLHVSLEHIS